MSRVIILAFVVAQMALWGAAIFALVYLGARLAIRHERRISS